MGDTDKGEAIRFCKGTYRGRTGWVDVNYDDTPLKKMIAVFVFCESGKELRTRVNKTSIKYLRDDKQPDTFEEALLHQHRDIDEAMDKLCRDLVKCGLHVKESAPEIAKIFIVKLTEAEAEQQMKGHKAVYRNVEWEYELETEEG